MQSSLDDACHAHPNWYSSATPSPITRMLTMAMDSKYFQPKKQSLWNK